MFIIVLLINLVLLIILTTPENAKKVPSSSLSYNVELRGKFYKTTMVINSLKVRPRQNVLATC